MNIRSALIFMVLTSIVRMPAKQSINDRPVSSSSNGSNVPAERQKTHEGQESADQFQGQLKITAMRTQNGEADRQISKPQSKSGQLGVKAKEEVLDRRFIRSLNGAQYLWSRDISGVHQSGFFLIRGNKVLLKWEENRPDDKGGASVRREEFPIAGRNFFRDDPNSCAIIFSGAQHCRCKYTIRADAIQATMLLDGKEVPVSGASFGICLAPSEIPRKH